MSQPRILFVTGKLAEPALRRLLAELAPHAGFDYSVVVLPITVVALATTSWLARHLGRPTNVDRVILPGLCVGDPSTVAESTGIPTEHGPADLQDLPEFFQKENKRPADYGTYNLSILAEINHAPRRSLDDILAEARRYRTSGADVIDVGCDPGETWSGVRDVVRALRDEGMRVSIDSFNPQEVDAAVAAGAELVLSVNGTNCAAARSWSCEVVAIPDEPANLQGLDQTVEKLQSWGIPYRIDPILEPIGFGFAASLGRYLEARRRYPSTEMMMGVGNLTELTDVDSAGINVLLAGFCEELRIRSVLTTEVINWCRSSIRELDLARRLVAYSYQGHVLPKKLEPALLLLRDPKLRAYGEAFFRELAGRITDPNFRLFAERGQVHVLNRDMYLQGTDPFVLFKQMVERTEIDSAHAFYLGYEMAKAVTALTLGKNYVQDQALQWGFLTVPEKSHQGTIGSDPLK